MMIQPGPESDYLKYSLQGSTDPIEREVEVMTGLIDDFVVATGLTILMTMAIESRQLSRVEHNVELSMIWLVMNGD